MAGTPHLYPFVREDNPSAGAVTHDAAAAHALMQAMNEGQEDWNNYGEPSPNSIKDRADKLMAEWGFVE